MTKLISTFNLLAWMGKIAKPPTNTDKRTNDKKNVRQINLIRKSVIVLTLLSLPISAETLYTDDVDPSITTLISSTIINPTPEERNSGGSPLLSPSTTQGTPTAPQANEDVMERLNVNDSITPETSDLLGERIDLNTGSLSFQQTDISLPGNNGLEVALRRSFKGGHFSNQNTLDFADWMLDIPHIHTTLLKNKFRYSGAWGQGRECSGELNPGEIADFGSTFMSFEYWNGDTLSIPGQVNEKLLKNNGRLTSKID